MDTHTNKTQENKSQSVIKHPQTGSGGEATAQFVDNRPETVAQLQLRDMVNNSPQVQKMVQLQSMADNYMLRQPQPIQRKESNAADVVQLNKHKKGKSRVTEGRQQKNANKRVAAERAREQEVQNAEAWSETVSD
jgi:hypothetical protein